MLKKLNILILILSVTLTSISQTDTQNDSIVCVSKWLMHKVIQDLEIGDLAKEQIVIERQIHKTLEKQLAIKDTIISSYKLKESNFQNEMDVITEVMKLKDGQIAVAKDETKHYKKQRNLFGVGGGGIIALIILILL
jgi:hypothetical protein